MFCKCLLPFKKLIINTYKKSFPIRYLFVKFRNCYFIYLFIFTLMCSKYLCSSYTCFAPPPSGGEVPQHYSPSLSCEPACTTYSLSKTLWNLSTQSFFPRNTVKMDGRVQEFSASINNPCYSLLFFMTQNILFSTIISCDVYTKLYESLFSRYEISALKIRTIHKRSS